MPRAQPILETRDLTVRRGDTVLLDAVSWRVERGQHWVILGANGAGKTSLLSALTGYLTPTAGAIHVLGRSYGADDWRILRRRIGLVSSALRQRMADAEPAVESVASGKDAVIDLWGRVSRADRARALRLLRQVDCAAVAERPWQVLSQGERQRVLIARALMARPRLLILDEPCAGLDPAAREHFLEFLQRLAARPQAPTLVLVTHHVEEIRPSFTHVLMLRRGRVLAAGPTGRCLTGPGLSAAFGLPIRVHRHQGQYQLTVAPRSRGVV